MQVLDWAVDNALPVDTVMVSLAMDICAKAAAHGRASLDDARGVLEYSKGLANKPEPNVVTFTSMMDLCAKAATFHKAQAQVDCDSLPEPA
jgi:hypothetical protein